MDTSAVSRSMTRSKSENPGFLGKGGFGCVVAPAIVLPNSVNVTRATKKNFVTKLGTDLENGYILGKQIKKQAPDVGIYPVDDIYKDFNLSSLGPNASDIIAKCHDLLTETNVQAVQYPKFLCDLDKYQTTQIPKFTADQLSQVQSIATTQLIKKIQTLHENNIVHLDIKSKNIAVIWNPDNDVNTVVFKIADFDLAAKLDRPEIVKITVDQLAVSYTLRIMSDAIQDLIRKDKILEIKTKFILVIELTKDLDTIDEIQSSFLRRFLKTIDLCCLVNTMWESFAFYEASNDEFVTLFQKLQTEFWDAYTESDIQNLFTSKPKQGSLSQSKKTRQAGLSRKSERRAPKSKSRSKTTDIEDTISNVCNFNLPVYMKIPSTETGRVASFQEFLKRSPQLVRSDDSNENTYQYLPTFHRQAKRTDWNEYCKYMLLFQKYEIQSEQYPFSLGAYR